MTEQDIVTVQPIDLNTMMEERELKPLPYPAKALKNRAAQTALLTDTPEKVVEQYQSIMSEAESGIEYTRDKIHSKSVNRQKESDISTVMSILADQTIPLEQKKAAIASVNSEYRRDTSFVLGTEAYSQGSKGENIEQESVRISGAEQFSGILEYNRYVQSLKNKHEIGWKTLTDKDKTVSDFLAFLAPFSTNKYGVSTLKPIADELELNISKGKAAVLPGSALEEISKAVANIPPSKKYELAQKLGAIIEKNSGLIFNKDNDFVALQQIHQILEGDYSKFDKYVDNTVGILDTIGLGGVFKGFKNLVETKLFARNAATEESKMIQRGVTDTTSPVSSMSIMSDANPEKARNIYTLVVKSESDEVAEALTGTNRTEAIAQPVIPQPRAIDGSVSTKLIEADRGLKEITPDESLISVFRDRGGIEFSEMEVARAEANITNDMRNVSGITVHDNLLSVGREGDSISIKAMFGSTEGGFLKSDEALKQAEFSLRQYGVKESDLQLYKRIEGEYVPITKEEALGVDGDYLVALDMKHQINPYDIVEMDKLDVKRNWFDRFPSLRSRKSGTVARMLLDAASMLHPQISGGAVVAWDKAVLADKRLLELHDAFAKSYKSHSADRQAKLFEHIKEANRDGLELSDIELMGRGFFPEEIDTLKKWRNSWDNHFWFENADLAHTLNIQGYQLFERGEDRFFAKAIQKNRNVKVAYDPESGKLVNLSPEDVDKLYEAGGTYASFRRPVVVDGVTTEHMIVRNTPDSYLRGIRESDQVLNYRKGYYQIQYDAPHFITRKFTTAEGNEYQKAVAVAGDRAEADAIRQRLITSEGLGEEDVIVRDDLKKLSVDTDAYWDLQNSSGRLSQRHRGKRLENTVNPAIANEDQFIRDPIDSAIRAARSLSTRIATRDFLELSKQRAIQQYAKYFPSNQYGQKQWVADSNSLVALEGSKYDKELADARTTVEYLNYLENGYINSLDETLKGLFNDFANTAAKMGSSSAERGLRAVGEVGPTQFLKSGVFTSYLALNPLRQAIIQSHQAIRLAALNPEYMFTKLPKDVAVFGAYKMNPSMKLTAEQSDMIKFIENSGMLDGVDKQNLVRGALSDLVDNENKILKGVGTAVSTVRKVGYDIGEQGNLLSHLLVLRDRALKAGKNLNDPKVRDELYSEVRAISYDMNFAGDSPYNQNSMALFLQFLQVPHKAFTSVMTNRRVSGTLNPVSKEFYNLKTNDKLRLVIADTLLWGVPGSIVISNLVGKDMLPEDPEAREAVLFGLESWAMNHMLSQAVGRDVGVDFSGFSPYNTDGFAHLFHAIATGGVGEYVQNSPAFSLYFKEGSKMREAFGKLFRYTGFIDTQSGLETPDALAVLNAFAEAGSSGWSNYNKAKAILELGKVKSAKGGVLMDDAGYVEAAAKLFGFSTQEEVLKYGALKAIREGSAQHKKEVLQVYNSYIRLLSQEQKLSNEDPEWSIKVLGAMKLTFKNDLTAMQIINEQLKKDIMSNDQKIITGALKYALPDGAGEASLQNLRILKDQELNNALTMHNDLREQAKRYGEK